MSLGKLFAICKSKRNDIHITGRSGTPISDTIDTGVVLHHLVHQIVPSGFAKLDRESDKILETDSPAKEKDEMQSDYKRRSHTSGRETRNAGSSALQPR